MKSDVLICDVLRDLVPFVQFSFVVLVKLQVSAKQFKKQNIILKRLEPDKAITKMNITQGISRGSNGSQCFTGAPQSAFTCLKSTTEPLEKCAKFVQS